MERCQVPLVLVPGSRTEDTGEFVVTGFEREPVWEVAD
jgi:hypothetical protein